MKALIGLTISLLLIATPHHAVGSDYEQLQDEFNNYEAPAYYNKHQSAQQPSAKKVTATNNELTIKQQELTKLKKRWDSLIEKTAEDSSFFDFASDQSQKIRKIANTKQIHDLLQKELTLNTLIPAAFERNPGLQSAKKEWAATLERYSQATTLDKIMQQYNAFIKELHTQTGNQRQKDFMPKHFPFPGTLGLKGDIITKEVNIAHENHRIVLRDLVAQLKSAYYELSYLGEAIQITNENLKLLEHLESTAFVKYKTGQSSYSDVVKAQIKRSALNNDLVTLQEERKTTIAKLNQLLNLPPQFPLGQAQPATLRDTQLSLEDLIKTGLEHEQEIKRLKLEIEHTNLAIELAEKKFYPDFTLGVSYFEDKSQSLMGSAQQKENFNAQPVNNSNFWFGKNEAYVREARLKYQAMQKQLIAMQDKVRYAIKEQHFHLDTAKRNVILYRDSLLKLAQNALQVAETDYQSGKIDFLNVLDAQGIWLAYNLIYHRSLRDQNQNMAQLEQVIGTSLDNVGRTTPTVGQQGELK